MVCADFENRLSDYLDGLLDADIHRLFAEHALRCPVCHENLVQVKDSIDACRKASVPAPSAELEARILLRTMPETAMTCKDFEDCLTDYLDGFLPAPMYHRWERHAAVCDRCTELPGEVVRSIGACYTYKSEEFPVPAGLNARILQATLGTSTPEEVRARLTARIASRLRLWLDPIVSPQLATVAMMLLVAVFVLTNTVSADGSIGGIYSASLRLAGQSYGSRRGLSQGVKEFFVGGQEEGTQTPAANAPENRTIQKQDGAEKQKPQGSPNGQKRNQRDNR